MNRDMYNQNGHIEKVNPFHSSGFCIAFFIILAIAYWLFSFSYQYIRSLDWVKQTATITNVIDRFEFKKNNSKHNHGKEADTAKYRFEYSYEIGGNQYKGQGIKEVNLDIEKASLKWLETVEGFYRDSIERDEKLLNGTSDIKKRQRIEERILRAKEEIKKYEQEIAKTKDKLIRKNSKIDILVNPKFNENSMIHIEKNFSRYLLGFVTILFLYLIRLLSLFYAKYRYRFNILHLENSLSKSSVLFANKEYWTTLSIGCSFLKPQLKKDKMKNILHLSLYDLALLPELIFALGWLFLGLCCVSEMSIGDSDSSIMIIQVTVIMLPVVNLMFFSNLPQGEFDKEVNEYYCRQYSKTRGSREIKVKVCALSDIVALQLLPIYGFTGAVSGYQLNIIYDQNHSEFNRLKKEIAYKRHYALSYRKYDVVKESAQKLSEFLNVPVFEI